MVSLHGKYLQVYVFFVQWVLVIVVDLHKRRNLYDKFDYLFPEDESRPSTLLSRRPALSIRRSISLIRRSIILFRRSDISVTAVGAFTQAADSSITRAGSPIKATSACYEARIIRF